MRRNAERRADALLIIALAVFGVALTLPWIAQARAADARLGCADRLRRLGTAIAQFETVHGGLPPRRTTKPAYHGIGIHLLPYLNADELARQYQADKPFFDAGNQAVVRQPLEAFQCPAAPANREVPLAEMGGTFVGTTGVGADYFQPNSVKDSGLPADLTSNQRTALQDDRQMPRAATTDGQAQTLVFFEMAGRPDHYVRGIKQAERREAHPGWWGSWAAWNATQVWSYSDDGTIHEGPCSVNCNNEHGVFSFHPGGANILFLDGSIRFVTPKLDKYVLFALVTRDGGESLSQDDF